MDLEKCPFCGTADQIEVDDITTQASAVCCNNCGAIGPHALTKEDAARCWNSRNL
jgi:Lar family restriction alleviation protein